MTDPSPQRDIAWYAELLDRTAAAAQSDFELALNVRLELGFGLRADLPDDTSNELRAVVWVFSYVVDLTGKHARLVSRDNLGGEFHPPQIRDVPEDVRSVWRQLLEMVEAPAVKARLAHAVFQCGGSAGRDAAVIAIDSYIESAALWQHRSDGLDDLSAASRIARIIGEDTKAAQALELLLDISESALDENPSMAGLVLRPIAYATDEPLCPGRVDALLERAAIELPDARDRDQALELMQTRCGDEECRSALWDRRVGVYIDAADQSTDSAIMQMVLRRDALRTAETSGRRDLYKRAAAALQSTRDVHAEMIRFQSSSAIYEEEFRQVRDNLIQGDSWRQALVTFSMAGPLCGDHDRNNANTVERRQLSGLTSWLPPTLLGPDGLPIWEPQTPEDRLDYDLTHFEVNIIGGMLRPLISALHAIPERFGLPMTQELLEFLAIWPGMSRSVVHTICFALQRFWVGDSEGVIYTVLPAIETLVRNLILNVNHGMYRLQQTHAPGQYPGLGAMIDLLPDLLDIGPSWHRALKTILTHPAGFNLRNRLSHGIDQYADPGEVSPS